MQATYLIHDTQLDSFMKDVAKFQRRIEKGQTQGYLKATPVAEWAMITHEKRVDADTDPVLVASRPATQEQIAASEGRGFKPLFSTFTWVTVEGELPCTPGYEFVARYDFEEGTCISNSMPGKETPAEFRDVESSRCDHCNHHRARSNSYLIENVETGELKVVGRSCLKDYLGHGDAQKMAEMATRVRVFLEQDFSRGGHTPWVEPLSKVLQWGASIARVKHGFVSGAMASNNDTMTSTASTYHHLTGPAPRGNARAAWELERIECTPTEEDEATAEAAVQWLAAQSCTSEYLDNLRKLVLENTTGMIRTRRVSLVISLIGAYRRSVEAEQAKLEERTTLLNEHAAPVGDRVEFDGVVKMVKWLGCGEYGDRYLVKFQDTEGRAYTWFTGNGDRYEQGEEVHAKGTVKDHNEYEGRKETVLTRVRT